jgi:hypothetical protein
MLMTGLGLQIAGLMLLSVLDPTWSVTLSVTWVVAAQGIAGVAKDITKTASKSAIKATSEVARASCSDGSPGPRAPRMR